MRYRLLGRTGLYVSELCLGTMTFGGQGFWKVMGGLGQDAATALVKQAFEAGVNLIDTANVYSLGESETLAGNAIKSLGLPRDELIVATKATGVMDEKAANARGPIALPPDEPGGREPQAAAARPHRPVPAARLRSAHAAGGSAVRVERPGPLGQGTVHRSVQHGGLAGHEGLAISEKNRWTRFESVQAYYTIAGRDLEREMLPLAQDQQLGLMVWSPLAGGLLSGKFRPDEKGPEGARRASFDFPVVDKARAFRCVDAMRAIAERHRVSVARVALAWLLGRPQVSTVIVGAKTPANSQTTSVPAAWNCPPRR